MLSPIASALHTHPATAAPTRGEKSPEAKPRAATDTQDTVHLSSAAQAKLSPIKALAQEVAETSAQTAKEARSGDRQAQRLLAREAASAKAEGG